MSFEDLLEEFSSQVAKETSPPVPKYRNGSMIPGPEPKPLSKTLPRNVVRSSPSLDKSMSTRAISLDQVDVDELLQDLDTDTGTKAPKPSNKTKAYVPRPRQLCAVDRTNSSSQSFIMANGLATTIKPKCVTVAIGGTSDSPGLNQSCNKLRCLSCDFTCISFPDAIWNGQCEYLVFRNYMPDREKLGAYLIQKKGYIAYCCQCSWTAVAKMTPVSVASSKLKWVCGGHEPA